MKSAEKTISCAAVIIALGAGVYTYTLSQKVSETDQARESIIQLASESRLQIEQQNDSLAELFLDVAADRKMEFKAEIAAITETEIETSLQDYTDRLVKLRDEIAEAEKKRAKAEADTQRTLRGLPAMVDLRGLNEVYVQKFNAASSYGTVESFSTRLGNLSFQRSDFDFKYFPSKSDPIKLKIGKKRYEGSFELMDAWLDESVKTKIENGYAVIEEESKITRYGVASWRLLEKGDLYCKVYKESTQYKGATYNSTHSYYT